MAIDKSRSTLHTASTEKSKPTHVLAAEAAAANPPQTSFNHDPGSTSFTPAGPATAPGQSATGSFAGVGVDKPHAGPNQPGATVAPSGRPVAFNTGFAGGNAAGTAGAAPLPAWQDPHILLGTSQGATAVQAAVAHQAKIGLQAPVQQGNPAPGLQTATNPGFHNVQQPAAPTPVVSEEPLAATQLGTSTASGIDTTKEAYESYDPRFATPSFTGGPSHAVGTSTDASSTTSPADAMGGSPVFGAPTNPAPVADKATARSDSQMAQPELSPVAPVSGESSDKIAKAQAEAEKENEAKK